jgi:DNA-binding protein HU-beta
MRLLMSMNKTELVNAVAEKAGLKKVEAEAAVKSTIEAISEELAGGGSVTLIGFGTFSVMERAARNGKNPRTGEEIKIPAKSVPKFKPGKALSESVNTKKKGKKKK